MKHCPTSEVHSFAFSYQSFILKNCQGLYYFLSKTRFTLKLNKRNLPTNMESFIFDNLSFLKNNREKLPSQSEFCVYSIVVAKRKDACSSLNSPTEAFTCSCLSDLFP